MKTTLSILLLAAAAQIGNAQGNSNVTGTVQDASGKPVHYVFVGDLANKNAVFTDSLGNFTISTNAGSKLTFQHAGYKDTSIIANAGAPMQVILAVGSVATAGGSTDSGQPLSEGMTKNEIARESNDVGGYLKPTHEKGDTRGSQYLFETFVPGYMLKSSGDIVYKPNVLFDYDKMTSTLILTRDNKTILLADGIDIKCFSLFSKTNQRFDFELIPAVDKAHYVQVLASGGKYEICKVIKTRFAKADYVNNGPAAHGHDYDEYIDEPDYYVLNVQDSQAVKFSLKKKGIKEAFAKEADKVNKFLSDNSGSINDAYLSKLGNYMNQ